MDRSAVLQKVIEVINDTLEVGDVELGEQTTYESLDADSFDLLELVTALEDEFGATMDDEAIEQIATIGDTVDAVLAAK